MRVSSVHALYLHDIDAATHKENHTRHYEIFVKEGYLAFEELKTQKNYNCRYRLK